MTIDQGTNTLLGLDPAGIAEVPRLLREEHELRLPPLWDGSAGRRAAAEIAALLGLQAKDLSPGEALEELHPALWCTVQTTSIRRSTILRSE